MRGNARRRHSRTALAAGLALALILAAAGVMEYAHLTGNLHSLPLFAGVIGDAGTEKADPSGHTPINMLVIGSDTRDNPEDCQIGHDCGPGANADVELLAHVSADRGSATVMSIPRDTMVQLPECQDPMTGRVTPAHYGQINSSLNQGPGCTVAAVHQLTGVPIDHFAMLDFAGVVAMSDAVGGVPICVSDRLYDPYSHLKLAAGNHVLKGMPALEFVRSRHAFGDGSDLGRTHAQHLFLASMVRTLKGTGVLTDPAAMLSLADAATKALTVDSGLKSIAQLLALANELNKVPPERIRFLTMPTAPDPGDYNRVEPASSASSLFEALANDQPLTMSESTQAGRFGAPSSADGPASRPPVDVSQIVVRVLNGSGRPDRASMIAADLLAHGFSPRTSFGTAAAALHTSVRYPTGHLDQAKALAAHLHLPDNVLELSHTGSLQLIIGRDWTSGTSYPASASAADAIGSSPPPSSTGSGIGTASTPAEPRAQTADQSTACAPVSKARTVVLDGVAMNPTQAYARASSIPDSAP